MTVTIIGGPRGYALRIGDLLTSYVTDDLVEARRLADQAFVNAQRYGAEPTWLVNAWRTGS